MRACVRARGGVVIAGVTDRRVAPGCPEGGGGFTITNKVEAHLGSGGVGSMLGSSVGVGVGAIA